MEKPMTIKDIFTHYTYIASPVGREPTGLLDLRVSGENTRRRLIHSLVANGELLARVPFPGIENMVHLRAAIKKS